MNTMQYEFDAVVAHLYKQGRPARGVEPDGPGCYYRTEDRKLSCAVGCRIPDDKYDPAMDVSPGNSVGTGVHSLISRFGSILPPEILAYENMFDRLQQVHDGAYINTDGTFKLDYLEQRLRSVAGDFCLTFIVPTQGE